MSNITTALFFASGMILLALGIAEGVVPEAPGTSVLLGLPALAMMSLRPAKSCSLAKLRNRVLG